MKALFYIKDRVSSAARLLLLSMAVVEEPFTQRQASKETKLSLPVVNKSLARLVALQLVESYEIRGRGRPELVYRIPEDVRNQLIVDSPFPEEVSALMFPEGSPLGKESPTYRLLMIILLSFSESWGVVSSLGFSEIARWSGCSKSTIRKQIHGLESKGYIRHHVPGFSGNKLIGRLKSVFYLDFRHPLFKPYRQSACFVGSLGERFNEVRKATMLLRMKKFKSELSPSLLGHVCKHSIGVASELVVREDGEVVLSSTLSDVSKHFAHNSEQLARSLIAHLCCFISRFLNDRSHALNIEDLGLDSFLWTNLESVVDQFISPKVQKWRDMPASQEQSEARRIYELTRTFLLEASWMYVNRYIHELRKAHDEGTFKLTQPGSYIAIPRTGFACITQYLPVADCHEELDGLMLIIWPTNQDSLYPVHWSSKDVFNYFFESDG